MMFNVNGGNMKSLIGSVLLVISMVLFTGCSGEDVIGGGNIGPIGGGPHIPVPIFEPVGFAKLIRPTQRVQSLSFDITDTQGKSPLYHEGSARFAGHITFGQLTDFSFNNAYGTTSAGNRCPISGIPITFTCQARISARNFSQCSFSTNGGNYVISGSFFSARSSKDKNFDILYICVEGPCAGPPCGFSPGFPGHF